MAGECLQVCKRPEHFLNEILLSYHARNLPSKEHERPAEETFDALIPTTNRLQNCGRDENASTN
jgi:hypothetical protein